MFHKCSQKYHSTACFLVGLHRLQISAMTTVLGSNPSVQIPVTVLKETTSGKSFPEVVALYLPKAILVPLKCLISLSYNLSVYHTPR